MTQISTLFGGKNTLPTGPSVIRLFDNTNMTINGKIDYFPQNSSVPELKDLTFISMIDIQVGSNQIIANMFHPNIYYKVDGDHFTKIVHDPFFTFYEWNDSAVIGFAQSRHDAYVSSNGTDQFFLKYIGFPICTTEIVYIELMFITYRKNLVNIVSIVSSNMASLIDFSHGALVTVGFDPQVADSVLSYPMA